MRTQMAGGAFFRNSFLTVLGTLLVGSALVTPSRLVAADSPARTDANIDFDTYFENKALRLEMFQTGDAKDELVTLHEIYEEPIWPESPKRLIPTMELGRYAIRVRDEATDKVIYVR